jgi:cytoskeletal protein RodZ
MRFLMTHLNPGRILIASIGTLALVALLASAAFAGNVTSPSAEPAHHVADATESESSTATTEPTATEKPTETPTSTVAGETGTPKPSASPACNVTPAQDKAEDQEEWGIVMAKFQAKLAGHDDGDNDWDDQFASATPPPIPTLSPASAAIEACEHQRDADGDHDGSKAPHPVVSPLPKVPTATTGTWKGFLHGLKGHYKGH